MQIILGRALLFDRDRNATLGFMKGNGMLVCGCREVPGPGEQLESEASSVPVPYFSLPFSGLHNFWLLVGKCPGWEVILRPGVCSHVLRLP